MNRLKKASPRPRPPTAEPQSVREAHEAAPGSDADPPVDFSTEPRDDKPVLGGTEQTPPAAESAPTLPVELESARLLPRLHLRGLLEALVFASDRPVTTHELAKLASAPVKEVKDLLGELRETYAPRGIVLGEIAGGWLFRTNAQFAPFVRELTSERPVRLSRAQVETLAIAAYRQPITRPEIDEIRGVESGATLKLLLERDLLRILGKKDEPGRPLLYGTTAQFLEFFGLKSLKDLPTLREFAELSDESRAVAEAELGDVLPEAKSARASEPAGFPTDDAAPLHAEPPLGFHEPAAGRDGEDAGEGDGEAITDPERVLGGYEERDTESEPPGHDTDDLPGDPL